MILDIINIICRYMEKKDTINLAKTRKEYYRYIMNERSIMERYSMKLVRKKGDLEFIDKLSYKIFKIDLEYCNIND